MFLVHQITFQGPARPKFYVTNDWGSSVAKNVCSLPGEKLVGWLFNIFCQYGHEKKSSGVEIKELVMGVGSTSAPWKRGKDRLLTCLQEGGGSVLLFTMQDASLLYKCMEVRPLLEVRFTWIWMNSLLERLTFVEMEGCKSAKFLAPSV